MKKIYTIIAILLAILTSGNAICQKSQNYWDFDKWGEVYFSFQTDNAKDLQALSRIISIDKYDNGTVIAYANERTFNEFLQFGYEPTILLHPSTIFPEEEFKMYTLDQFNAKETYEWDSYPTYPAYVAMMDEFQTDYPSICTTIHLAPTVQNRELIICKLTSANNPTTKTRVLLTSSMHGDETTGIVLLLRMIDYLCTHYGTDTRITGFLDNAEIWICPMANPDGTYHGGNNTVFGSQRYNGNNCDLNRNYKDDAFGDHPDGNVWQPETIAFMNLVDTVQFTISFNYHGGAEVCNYPWDNKSPLHADNAWWVLICREYADTAHVYNSSYMTYLQNGITNGYQWYTITGSRQDNANAFHNLKEVTIEISNTKTLPASQLPNHWNWNYRSVLNFIQEALYGIHGTVTDAETGNPINDCQIFIEGHDTNGSHSMSDPYGYYARPIKGGTYNVTYMALGYEPVTIPITISDFQTVVQDVQLTYTGMTVSFEADATNVSLGGTVNFTNSTYSQDPITSYYWEFPGGTPSTSTEENPSVVYSSEGTFDVTLTVTSESETATLTKENYITVTNMYLMQTGTFTTCSGMFFDDGGPSGNYGNQKNYTITFTPSTPGAQMSVTFESFHLENNYDFLFIYDGPNTSSPSLGTYSGTSSPGTKTSTAEDGSLTFKFTSDYSVTYDGWSAVLSCIGGNPCVAPQISGTFDLVGTEATVFLSWEEVAGSSGYKVYRNDVLLGSTTSASFEDTDLISGNQYCYTVKSICEDGDTEPSNQVCFNYLLGDANDDGTVNVSDIMTLINYLMNGNPDNIVLPNADVNQDGVFNVIDVVCIVNIITSGSYTPDQCNNPDDSAVYTIKNGVLYLNTTKPLSGIQFTFKLNGSEEPELLQPMNNFETNAALNAEGQYVVIAYGMDNVKLDNGEYAIMNVAEATIVSAVFCDPFGCKVNPVDGNALGIEDYPVTASQPYPSPFSNELTIPYIVNEAANNVEFVITSISGKVVTVISADASAGSHKVTWNPEGIADGMYIITLRVDGSDLYHSKVILQK